MTFLDSRVDEISLKAFVKPNNLKHQATLPSLKLCENLINVLHIRENIFNQKARMELINVSSAMSKIPKIRRVDFCGSHLNEI